MNRKHVNGAILAPLLLALAGCRAFESPIPEREGRWRVDAQSLPLHIGEDYPEEWADEVGVIPASSHLDAVPARPVSARLETGERLQRLEVRGSSLGGLLTELAERAGIRWTSELDLSRPVDVSLPEMDLADAFQGLLEEHGLRLEQRASGRYSIVLDRDLDVLRASFRLRSARAEDVETSLRALVGPSTRLVVDAAARLVVASGPRRELEELAQFLEEADRLPAQILVEARILEVTLGESFQFGIGGELNGSWDGTALGLVQELANNELPFGFTLTSPGGSVDATIRAISRYVGTDLVSSPRILALSGTEAEIAVIREVPYIQVTSTTTGTTGGIGTQTLEEVQFKEAGVRLKVTPLLQDGGYIRLRVDQVFSEVVDTFQDIPIIDSRTIGLEFQVRDRETVVLGGLMQDRRREIDRGVPGLARIPLIGRLFRSDDDERQKRELIVFLTPRVVDDPESERIVRAMRRAYVDTLGRSGVRSTQEGQVSPW